MRQREGSGAFDVLADWLTNLNFDRASSVQGGQVHSGFKKALDEVWDSRGAYPRFLFQPVGDFLCVCFLCVCFLCVCFLCVWQAKG